MQYNQLKHFSVLLDKTIEYLRFVYKIDYIDKNYKNILIDTIEDTKQYIKCLEYDESATSEIEEYNEKLLKLNAELKEIKANPQKRLTKKIKSVETVKKCLLKKFINN